ncbi:histidine phosphatase family protein [Ornithinicoccus halotolerans]
MTASSPGDAPRTVVHLMRHGEVDNPHGILYGRLPGYHLSPLGQEMATRVAEHLRDHAIRHLVSSPLERAQQTAAPVGEILGLPVETDERIIEASNHFEGVTVGGGPNWLRRPRHWHRLHNPLRPSWGEPYRKIAARMAEAVEDARAAAEGHEALLVSHQLPIWTLRRTIEGRRLWHDPRRRQCSLASLTSITFIGSEPTRLDYSEPAGDLLQRARPGAGA